MDAFAVGGFQLSPTKDFDEILDIRAQKREHLRGRNNKTSCRSPTRDLDAKQIKNNLKDKRHLQFLKRRSVSPESHGSKSTNSSSRRTPAPPNTVSKRDYSVGNNSETLHPNTHPGRRLTPNSSATDQPSTSRWASLWSEQITLTGQDTSPAGNQASTSTAVPQDSTQHSMKSTQKNKSDNKVQQTVTATEQIPQNLSTQRQIFLQKNMLKDSRMHTEPGFVIVKESDIERLAEYLQEALWREEVLRKKLAALQESTSNLLNSSSKIWTTRCSEDLLRSNIKALEAQLHVFLQKSPRDGMKKLMVQMEKQRLLYEEKALAALQKASQEKTEALTQAEILQEAVITAKAETLRWQSLYEELKLSSGRLRQSQHVSDEQLQQLHSQVELSRSREDELREEVLSLRQEKKDLQYNICLLQEDNQTLREETQHLRDNSDESLDDLVQECLLSERNRRPLVVRRDSTMEEQLRHSQEKLQLKERECEELQMELHAMEQECQSSQARLSQCRDELRQLSHHRRTPKLSGSWWWVCVIVLLLLAVAGSAMLFLWHPPFREQVQDLYSDIETRIQDYLMEMSSSRHSGCFRPI